MKVLVTGAGGFIGFHLCNALAENKIDTFGLDNFNKYYDVNLKKNRIENVYLHHNDYFQQLPSYKFVISPEGNGIDCHRTWEALYVGSIPIVIKNNIYNNWSDLPILQVSSYSDITQDLLDTFIKQTYSYKKLSIDYWKNEFKYVND